MGRSPSRFHLPRTLAVVTLAIGSTACPSQPQEPPPAPYTPQSALCSDASTTDANCRPGDDCTVNDPVGEPRFECPNDGGCHDRYLADGALSYWECPGPQDQAACRQWVQYYPDGAAFFIGGACT